MEFIMKSYHNLITHLMDNEINLKKSDFELLNSLEQETSKKVGVYFINLLVDREKTPRSKIIREKKSQSKNIQKRPIYYQASNYFELFFLLRFKDLDHYAMTSKILVDFEDFSEEGQVKLLNSIEDFNRYQHLFEWMLKYQESFPALFVKISQKEKTLQTLPPLKKVVEQVKLGKGRDKPNSKNEIYNLNKE